MHPSGTIRVECWYTESVNSAPIGGLVASTITVSIAVQNLNEPGVILALTCAIYSCLGLT